MRMSNQPKKKHPRNKNVFFAHSCNKNLEMLEKNSNPQNPHLVVCVATSWSSIHKSYPQNHSRWVLSEELHIHKYVHKDCFQRSLDLSYTQATSLVQAPGRLASNWIELQENGSARNLSPNSKRSFGLRLRFPRKWIGDYGGSWEGHSKWDGKAYLRISLFGYQPEEGFQDSIFNESLRFLLAGAIVKENTFCEIIQFLSTLKIGLSSCLKGPLLLALL